MQSWKHLGRKTLLKLNDFLTVEQHKVQTPDGEIIDDWAWVTTPDFINVFAITPEHQILCLSQEKYGLYGPSLAPVGGYLEPNETPLQAAQRELMEEAGFMSKKWEPIGSYVLCPNRGLATAHLFLAWNARKVSEPTDQESEILEIKLLKIDKFEEAVKQSDFKVLAWQTTALEALLAIKQKQY